MGLQSVFQWWSQPTSPITLDDSVISGHASDTLDPFDSTPRAVALEFRRSDVKPQIARKYSSLLTKAINGYNIETEETEPTNLIIENSGIRRPQSFGTNSPELTSDGGTTSSSLSHTPNSCLDQHPQHNAYSFTEKHIIGPVMINASPMSYNNETTKRTQTESSSVMMDILGPSESNVLPCLELQQSTPPRKRSILFICNDGNGIISGSRSRSKSHPHFQSGPIFTTDELEIGDCHPTPPQPRKSIIKFACSGPLSVKVPGRSDASSAPLNSSGHNSTPSSLGRNSLCTNKIIEHKIRRQLREQTSRSIPMSINPGLSQATDFFEFASEEVEVENWLRQDLSPLTSKLTIKDTFKKENEIRRLASEVEQEELDEVEANRDDSEGDDEEDEEDDDDDDEEEGESNDFEFEFDSSDVGNQTDNEGGFTDSDESDFEKDNDFWTPRRDECKGSSRQFLGTDFSSLGASAHYRSGSNSSTDIPPNERNFIRGKRHRRKLKIMRPGTPDLPDSTDFVCGTLDEDRPLEEAYLSCLEARKQARHKLTPQDIDPSFPTSDTDEDQKDNKQDVSNFSEGQRKNHNGKSDLKGGRLSRNISRNRGSISCYSPKKLHSPPPPKHRFRSPSRKTFNKSPKRSIPTTPSHERRLTMPISPTKAALIFPLGTRSRVTHTKSLPRTPNLFGLQYCEFKSRLFDDSDTVEYNHKDHHVRGAIDIVKGLERKRQRRKEKLYMKPNNRKTKANTDRKPQPGLGAERMREVGLTMAGRTGGQRAYMLSA
ncbi:hypothetical protein EV44_g5533 [Erysiphe necator]|uniref:Uncharacterized protein n=1 Tax=Uncinula necator TaxID=52586 RepID=A0A0B1P1T7_UNCNE|nr:hypothetical protein EV44_g5533 [Erysiphe necator]